MQPLLSPSGGLLIECFMALIFYPGSKVHVQCFKTLGHISVCVCVSGGVIQHIFFYLYVTHPSLAGICVFEMHLYSLWMLTDAEIAAYDSKHQSGAKQILKSGTS